jgi:polar amino acid transport system substrate-binding protein
VIYSATSVCMFGRADNPKFANAKSVDELNSPDMTIAYFIGGGEEGWVKERFPKAKLRGVTNSGATAPVEEVMAKRADAAPINRVPYVGMAKKVKGLAVLPKENECQGSQEKAAPVGIGVDKNQAAFTQWLRAVAQRMKPQLDADERKIIDTL